MKKFWFVLMLIAVLSLGCWTGAEEECDHNCVRYWVGIGDSKQHGIKCSECGEILGYEDHFENCQGPGRCWGCGENGVKLSYFEHPWYVWKNLGNTHRQHCEYCDAVMSEESPHHVFCDAPTTCGACKAENVVVDEDEIIHYTSEVVDLGDGTHQHRCTGCGEGEISEHYASCLKPGVCEVCGAVSPDMGESHPWNADAPIVDSDSDYHYRACVDCGTLLAEYHSFDDDSTCEGTCEECGFRGSHWVLCSSPDTCQKCKSKVSGYSRIDMFHKADELINNEATDTSVCDNCGICVSWTGVFTWEDGCVRFENECSSFPGDADNNSSVTLSDVRAILSGNVSSESNADVTGDGKVDTQDVLRIMQYIAGWGVTLQ